MIEIQIHAQYPEYYCKTGVDGYGTETNAIKVVSSKNGNVYAIINQDMTGTKWGKKTGIDFLTMCIYPDSTLNTTCVPKWSKYYNTNEDDIALDIAVDDQENIYVVGNSVTFKEGNEALREVVIIKYNAQGKLIWSKKYDSDYSGLNAKIALTEDNKIYLVYTRSGPIESIGELCIINIDSQANKIFTYKYPKTIMNPEYLKCDKNGNLYITGKDYDKMKVIKCSAKGDLMWVNSIDNDGNQSKQTVNYNNKSYAIEIGDGIGKYIIAQDEYIYVSGEAIIYGMTKQQSALFILQYSNEGNLIWSQFIVGDGYDEGNNVSTGMVMDSYGNIIVSGIVRNSSSSDLVLTKFSNTGTEIWRQYYPEIKDGTSYQNLLDIEVLDNLYVSAISDNGIVNLKYNSSGENVGSVTIQNSKAEFYGKLNYLCVAKNNSCFIAGSLERNGKMSAYLINNKFVEH